VFSLEELVLETSQNINEKKVVDTFKGRCYTLCNTNPAALNEEIFVWIRRNSSVQVVEH